MGVPVAIVVDLLLADKASALEFPPIIDLFKILRLESVAVLYLAFEKNTNIYILDKRKLNFKNQ